MSWAGRSETTRDFITLSEWQQCKIYELFIFGTFHLIFLDHSLPWVTEIAERETMDKGDYYTCGGCVVGTYR